MLRSARSLVSLSLSERGANGMFDRSKKEEEDPNVTNLHAFLAGLLGVRARVPPQMRERKSPWVDTFLYCFVLETERVKGERELIVGL